MAAGTGAEPTVIGCQIAARQFDLHECGADGEGVVAVQSAKRPSVFARTTAVMDEPSMTTCSKTLHGSTEFDDRTRRSDLDPVAVHVARVTRARCARPGDLDARALRSFRQGQLDPDPIDRGRDGEIHRLAVDDDRRDCGRGTLTRKRISSSSSSSSSTRCSRRCDGSCTRSQAAPTEPRASRAGIASARPSASPDPIDRQPEDAFDDRRDEDPATG